MDDHWLDDDEAIRKEMEKNIEWINGPKTHTVFDEDDTLFFVGPEFASMKKRCLTAIPLDVGPAFESIKKRCLTATPLDVGPAFESIKKRCLTDINGDTLIKAIHELKAERRSLPSTLKRLEAERHFWYNKSRELNRKRHCWYNKSRELNRKRHFWYNKSRELNRKWLSLFDESRLYTKRLFLFDEGRELTTELEVANRTLHVLHGVRGHVEGRLVALDKDIRRTKESTDALDTVFREFQVLRKYLQERNLKSELRNRIEFIRLIKIVICLLYALLNRSGRQRHGSQCDLGTILILLIRSGVEANPGPGPPRNWKDLPTTVRHLGILSSYIANGWEYYGDRLGLKEEDRDVIVAKYKHTQAQIYHMLKRAAIIPGNQSMRRLLMILEECEEEYIDMCITWDRLEFYFAEEEEEIQVAVQGSVERDGEDQNGSSSRGRKRISNFGQGESSVKVQRI